MRPVIGKARLPGEIGGPALAITIRLANSTGRAVRLDPVVNVYFGRSRTPATTLSGPPTAPFPSVLPAHGSVQGVYTFTLSAAQRKNLLIELTYSPAAPVVQFRRSG